MAAGGQGDPSTATEAKTRHKAKGAKKISNSDKLKVTVEPKVKFEKVTRSRALLGDKPRPPGGLSGFFSAPAA